MKSQEAKPMEDKEWEVECLAHKIREVEMAKQDEPEMYNKALAYLKKEAKAINSIEDIESVAKEKAEEDAAE